MSSTAINRGGQSIHVGDGVSILGKVVSVTGLGILASVTVQSPLDAGTYVIQANDASATQHNDGTIQNISTLDSPNSVHPAVSINGKVYGKATDDLTVLGVVTAISGTGIYALLTVLLKTSQTSIVTAAGNCFSEQRSSTVLP
jgi:hypothetical protein